MRRMSGAFLSDGRCDQQDPQGLHEADRLPATLTGFDSVLLEQGAGSSKTCNSLFEANAVLQIVHPVPVLIPLELNHAR